PRVSFAPTPDKRRGPMLERKELETKTQSGDLAGAFDDFMRPFEAFKDTNDERLDEIEKRCSADAVTVEKLSRIDRALDEHKQLVESLALKAARPPLGNGSAFAAGAALQHKAAFESYVR